MSVGGSSFNRGVLFVSDHYSVKFTMDKDNNYFVSSNKRLPTAGIKKYIREVPVLKGLFSLFFGNRLITAIILFGLVMDFFPYGKFAGMDTAFSVITSCVLLFLLLYMLKNIIFKLGDTWMYHGAEHKTIYAKEHGLELTLANVRKCPRVAKRCGTNLAVFILLFYLPLIFVTGYDSLRVIVAYVLAYELFDIKNGDKLPLIKLFYRLGYWCQQKFFTKEPSDGQIMAAIAAMKKLAELEGANAAG